MNLKRQLSVESRGIADGELFTVLTRRERTCLTSVESHKLRLNFLKGTKESQLLFLERNTRQDYRTLGICAASPLRDIRGIRLCCSSLD